MLFDFRAYDTNRLNIYIFGNFVGYIDFDYHVDSWITVSEEETKNKVNKISLHSCIRFKYLITHSHFLLEFVYVLVILYTKHSTSLYSIF